MVKTNFNDQNFHFTLCQPLSHWQMRYNHYVNNHIIPDMVTCSSINQLIARKTELFLSSTYSFSYYLKFISYYDLSLLSDKTRMYLNTKFFMWAFITLFILLLSDKMRMYLNTKFFMWAFITLFIHQYRLY